MNCHGAVGAALVRDSTYRAALAFLTTAPRLHLAATYLVTIDIKSFFPSIDQRRRMHRGSRSSDHRYQLIGFTAALIFQRRGARGGPPHFDTAAMAR